MVPEARARRRSRFYSRLSRATLADVAQVFPRRCSGFLGARLSLHARSTCTALSRLDVAQDPRVRLNICDGLKFVAVRCRAMRRAARRAHSMLRRRHQDAEAGSYDVIIVDSSDPVGPASVLFTKVRRPVYPASSARAEWSLGRQPFFADMHRALRPGGVICTQGECMWLHLDLIQQVAAMCREVRPQRRHAVWSGFTRHCRGPRRSLWAAPCRMRTRASRRTQAARSASCCAPRLATPLTSPSPIARRPCLVRPARRATRRRSPSDVGATQAKSRCAITTRRSTALRSRCRSLREPRLPPA